MKWNMTGRWNWQAVSFFQSCGEIENVARRPRPRDGFEASGASIFMQADDG
jgi:hypothetical protein